MKYYCPCCGFQTLEYQDSYDICDICMWEDDPFQRKYPFSDLWANHESLFEYQKNIMLWLPPEIQTIRDPSTNAILERNKNNFIIVIPQNPENTYEHSAEDYIKDIANS